MNMRALLPLSALPLLALACSNDPPAIPTWDQDVYPILRGSCGHCHGATADVQNMGATMYTPNTRYDICNSTAFNNTFMNEQLWIVGSDMMGKPVVDGAGPKASLLAVYVRAPVPAMRMPPPPASPLSDYEAAVLDRWANVNKGSCTKQAPNHKPQRTIVSGPEAVQGSNKVAVTVEVTDPDGDAVFGYVKLGNAAPQVIKGAGRGRYEFDGGRATDPLTIKLFDGYDAGP